MYRWLVATGREDLYADYLAGDLCRELLYATVPERVVSSVINDEIRPDTLRRIYSAMAIGVEPDVVADWRLRLARELTVGG